MRIRSIEYKLMACSIGAIITILGLFDIFYQFRYIGIPLLLVGIFILFVEKPYTDIEMVKKISKQTNYIVKKKINIEEVNIINDANKPLMIGLFLLSIIFAIFIININISLIVPMTMLPVGTLLIIILVYSEYDTDIKVENDMISIKRGWNKKIINIDNLIEINEIIDTFESYEGGPDVTTRHLKLRYTNARHKIAVIKMLTDKYVKYPIFSMFSNNTEEEYIQGVDLIYSNFITKKDIINRVSNILNGRKFFRSWIPNLDLDKQTMEEKYIDITDENATINFETINDIECERLEQNNLDVCTRISHKDSTYQLCDIILKKYFEKYKDRLIKNKVQDILFFESQIGSANCVEVWAKE